MPQVASEDGVSTEQAAGLSKVLPGAIDNVTPGGQIPSPDAVRSQLGSRR